jgi:two-component system LytT family response regulator
VIAPLKLRVFIVERDPAVCEHLRTLLGSEADLEVVGAGDGSAKCLRELRHARPDVIFLELQLAGSDGFEFLAQAKLKPGPAVIVVTTQPARAAEAFERQVTDFVVKPYRIRRLRIALDRARIQLAARNQPVSSKPIAANGGGHLVRFVIRNEQQLDVVRADQVDWLAAAGNYVILHTGRQTQVFRETLTAVETRLDPARFVRISRFALVNLDRIKAVITTAEDGAKVTLTDGTQLPLTRGIRELQSRLELG